LEFKNIDALRALGIKGLREVADLQKSACAEVPNVKGIYVVARTAKTPPVFIPKSCGGHFKKKDPTVSILELQENWVENSIVLYIGKAGGSNSNATLRKRLWQYMQFGAGKPIGHWGGRYIWQLKDSSDLLVGWKAFDHEEPSDVEGDLIAKFVSVFGKRPFANLKD
jgi:hypothetical protein